MISKGPLKSKRELWTLLFVLNLPLLILFFTLLNNPNLISSPNDLKKSFWPVYNFVYSNLKFGTLPFWNNTETGGISLFGSYSYAFGYPLNWLYFILPTTFASTLITYISVLLT